MRAGGRRTKGFSRLGRVLDGSLDALGIRGKVLQSQAVAAWSQVVGPHIASATRAESVRGGILFVSCKSSVWANELVFHKDDIVRRLSAAVRDSGIKDIRFSARGYRAAARRNGKEEGAAEEKGLDAVTLDENELEEATRLAAASSAPELAEAIRKAIITSKRLAKLRVISDG